MAPEDYRAQDEKQHRGGIRSGVFDPSAIPSGTTFAGPWPKEPMTETKKSNTEPTDIRDTKQLTISTSTKDRY